MKRVEHIKDVNIKDSDFLLKIKLVRKLNTISLTLIKLFVISGIELEDTINLLLLF